jgi:hypothetical protein
LWDALEWGRLRRGHAVNGFQFAADMIGALREANGDDPAVGRLEPGRVSAGGGRVPRGLAAFQASAIRRSQIGLPPVRKRIPP